MHVLCDHYYIVFESFGPTTSVAQQHTQIKIVEPLLTATGQLQCICQPPRSSLGTKHPGPQQRPLYNNFVLQRCS